MAGFGLATPSEAAGVGALGGLVERLVAGAFQRQRTRVTSTESDRSREAVTSWNLSRGQQAAELAQMVQRGMRNL